MPKPRRSASATSVERVLTLRASRRDQPPDDPTFAAPWLRRTALADEGLGHRRQISHSLRPHGRRDERRQKKSARHRRATVATCRLQDWREIQSRRSDPKIDLLPNRPATTRSRWRPPINSSLSPDALRDGPGTLSAGAFATLSLLAGAGPRILDACDPISGDRLSHECRRRTRWPFLRGDGNEIKVCAPSLDGRFRWAMLLMSYFSSTASKRRSTRTRGL